MDLEKFCKWLIIFLFSMVACFLGIGLGLLIRSIV